MDAKKLVQAGFGAFGLRLSRNKSVRGWDLFFSALKARGFTPKHIVDAEQIMGLGHAAHSIISQSCITR